MAYNKKNFLLKVLKVQEISQKYHSTGYYSYKQIYHQFIDSEFNISKRTFDTYLGINAKKELRELGENPDKRNGK